MNHNNTVVLCPRKNLIIFYTSLKPYNVRLHLWMGRIVRISVCFHYSPRGGAVPGGTAIPGQSMAEEDLSVIGVL